MASSLESREPRPGREPVVYHTDQGDITVQEFRPEDGDFMASAAGEGNWVSFGGGSLRPEVVFNDVIRAARTNHDGSIFLLSWEGNKVPRGVPIHGQKIGWT